MTVQQAQEQITAFFGQVWHAFGPWMLWAYDNPIIRTLALALVIYVTIRAIASIYGGDIQNGMLGPVAIRPHTNASIRAEDIKLPKILMPHSMDGVRADCDVFYVTTDSKGRRRSQRMVRLRHGTILVSPTPLPAVQKMYFGQEMTPAILNLHTEDVVIPQGEPVEPVDQVLTTPERVGPYIEQNRTIESWTEDDSATRISLHQTVIRELNDRREEFIVDGANRLRAARQGNWRARLKVGRYARERPAIIGSYYIKFKLSRDPLFILTRHPDRDLKMTAWLTVLTSLFAMLMEVWPLKLDAASARLPGAQASSEQSVRVVR